MAEAVLKVFRGDAKGGAFQEFRVPLDPRHGGARCPALYSSP